MLVSEEKKSKKRKNLILFFCCFGGWPSPTCMTSSPPPQLSLVVQQRPRQESREQSLSSFFDKSRNKSFDSFEWTLFCPFSGFFFGNLLPTMSFPCHRVLSSSCSSRHRQWSGLSRMCVVNSVLAIWRRVNQSMKQFLQGAENKKSLIKFTWKFFFLRVCTFQGRENWSLNFNFLPTSGNENGWKLFFGENSRKTQNSVGWAACFASCCFSICGKWGIFSILKTLQQQ